MNYLTLCQRTWQACALSGDGPGGVTSSNVMHQSVIQWVADAWITIQNMHMDWNFLTIRESGTPTLTLGQQTYVSADLGMSNFSDLRKAWIQVDGQWKEIRVYQEPVETTDYFNATDGQPQRILQAEDRTLWMDHIPDAAYPVRLKYTRTPQVLAANNDIPICPEHFHEIIVWKAVEYYGLYDQDQEMIAKGRQNFEEILRRMEITELPDWSFPKGELVHHARF